MADLSILDKLRFVASQQNQKKRNASSLVSLSQDSCSSTQPLNPPRQLSRQISEATTQVTCSRPPRRLSMAKHSIVSIVRESSMLQSTQTEKFESDNPPLSCDWSFYTNILDELRNISSAIESIRCSPNSHRPDLMGLEELEDSLVLSPEGLTANTITFSEQITHRDSMTTNDEWESNCIASSAVREIPVCSYESTVKLAEVIPAIPRPKPPSKKTISKQKPSPRRSSRLASLAEPIPIQVVTEPTLLAEIPKAIPLPEIPMATEAPFQVPEIPQATRKPFPLPEIPQATGGPCSLLRRIKKAVQSSSLL